MKIFTKKELTDKGIYKIVITYADNKKKSFDLLSWSIFGEQITKNVKCKIKYKMLISKQISNFIKNKCKISAKWFGLY